MRKSKAASSLSATASSSVESSSTTSSGPFSSSSSSSVPAISSAGDGGGDSGKNKNSGSSSSRSTTTTTAATINNSKSSTTTTTAASTGSNSSSSGGDGYSINGTRGSSSSSSSNDNNTSVQSAGQQQQQRPPLERQFDVITDPFARQFGVATAPLATFDTVDLSDEEVTAAEVTSTEDVSATTPTTNTNSPSSNDNICRNKTTTTTTTATTTTTTTMIATTTTITAAKTHEIKTTHNKTDTTSCSNSSNVSAASPRTSSTNNTNNTTITTTDPNPTPTVTSGKNGGKKTGLTHTTSGSNSTASKKSNNICGSSGKNSSLNNQTDAITSSAKSNRVESISARSLPHPDGVKDSVVTFEQTRVTDPHVNHSSSSDDEASSHVATGLSSVSSKCKPDSVSTVEPTRPTVGGEEGSTTATPSAGTSAAVGATAGSALLTATVDFANFGGSSEDLNSNNIGGSQSTSTVDGGGSTTPGATGGAAASKPKEVTTVEKASLLDESSSSDSDLSPTEPNPTGGAYTTLTSGSTPNLIRKVSMHDATGTIKENSGQSMDFNSPELMASSSKRKAFERRLQRLQVKTTPINRPRSTTPLSVVTLDEYTNLSSPEISPNLEKLKIVLPADQFGRPIKSPRSKENAFDFNEDRLFRHTKEAIVLQSDGSIGQSPRRIFIPPTLSPSQSPCKAAAGSPVSKLVLVSRLPAGTSPLVKSAAPPVISPPPSSTTTSFSCSTSSASSNPAWKTSEKEWEQFGESRSKLPPHQPQATCAIPKRSEPPVALPTFERKQSFTRTGSFETSSSKGHRDHEKRKKKGSFGEESTKTTFEQHTDSRRNTGSALNPSHHSHRVQMNCPDEEEEIIKIEIGSSDVGKAYNIELEVTAKEKMDSSHSKSSS